MPRRPVLSWLVLALAIEKSSHGYEIAGRYDRRFGTLLPAPRRAIYSALGRLERAKLVEPLPAELASSRGPKRVSYQPTSDAMRAHQQWLSSSILTPERWHQELLARIATAHLHGIQATLDLLAIYTRHTQMHQQRIQELIAERAAAGQHSLQALTSILVLQEQQATTTTHTAWATNAREQIERLRWQEALAAR